MLFEPHQANAVLDLPLLDSMQRERRIAWRQGTNISTELFLAHTEQVSATLPHLRYCINLCEDRYAFLVAFCAVLIRGQTNLLPPSRTPGAVQEVLNAHVDSYCLSDRVLNPTPHPLYLLPALEQSSITHCCAIPVIPAAHIAAIGYTSGSTGIPKANPKRWDSLHRSTALNRQLIENILGGHSIATIVATVPAQHMYGLELSILLPLLSDLAIHSAKPLFPADIVSALSEVPEPRILVTTPIHLRTLLDDTAQLPRLAAVLSATAPLSQELARAAENRWKTCVMELFGSTETCVIAHRRSAHTNAWQLHSGIELEPQADSTEVHAAHFTNPVVLQDVVKLLPERQFQLCGRNTDLVEIAGKRASIGDLTQRLLTISGVLDAAILQLDPDPDTGIARLAALVVAPQLSEATILAELRHSVDPVFLPRPLQKITHLPRNETGKLTRAALLTALRSVD